MPEEHRILISGSAAFDVIAFTGEPISDIFSNALTNKEDSEARISISFLVNKSVSFGGTALNIAYNVKLLGGNPLPISCVGKDFFSRKYEEHLKQLNMDTSGLDINENEDTAEAYIVTGSKGGQMSIFHTGALQYCCEIDIEKKIAGKNIFMGIVSPNPPETMLAHAMKLAELKIPYVADPGQMINVFSQDDLIKFVSSATILIVNDFEATLVENRTGKKLNEMVSIRLITQGEKGVLIQFKDEELHVPAIKIKKLVDPTGAGDAFRGGFLLALSKLCKSVGDITLEKLRLASQVGAVTGGAAVECSGTQNHIFTKNEFRARYEENYSKLEIPL
ncbi:MAG: carbohydrate kinase family protein [Candidatus Helarchaeota archaeon]